MSFALNHLSVSQGAYPKTDIILYLKMDIFLQEKREKCVHFWI